MHNYTVQNRFTTKTKLGNWYQQAQLKDYEFKQYLHKKNIGENVCLNTQSKLAFSNQQVALTRSVDGLLRFGDCVMLESLCTEGVLAFNCNEAILGEETYAVTTARSVAPVLRNTWQVVPVEETQSEIVRYGDKVRFVAYVNDKKLFLQSLAVSPMRSSKFSRHQQVSATVQQNSSSIWIFEHINPKHRFQALGEDVRVNSQILIKHNATSQWLASDRVNYVNEFGAEFETFGKSFLANNKTQNLYSEKVGNTSVENTLRNQGGQNSWRVLGGKE